MAESQDLPSNQASITPSLKAFEENLSRLANKPGVVATVILDAHNGSILKKASMSSAIPIFSTPQLQQASNDEADTSPTHDGLDDFALMVWNFMKGATSLIHHLDSEDETKLLRLRTKKSELVIVPDPKFILIVVHEVG